MSFYEGLEFRHVEVIGVTVNELPSPQMCRDTYGKCSIVEDKVYRLVLFF